MKNSIIRLVILIFTGLLLTNCIKNNGNHPPEITSLSVSPTTVKAYGILSLSCNAIDSDGDRLTYRWHISGELLPEEGPEITCLAPGVEGSYTISCLVTDDKSGEDMQSKMITVTPFQGTIVSGIINSSRIWKAENGPYIITENSLVESNVTLDIEPGTDINFIENCFLEIRGQINAVGIAENAIIFTKAFIKLFWEGEISYNPDGSYKDGPRFEHCDISDGIILIVNQSFDGYGPYMKHTQLHQLKAESFWLCEGAYIDHCSIDKVGSWDLDLNNSIITNSYIEDMIVDGYCSNEPFQITHCEIKNLFITRWSNENLIEFNNIGYIEWERPTDIDNPHLNNNNIYSLNSDTIFKVLNCEGYEQINATNNFWGPDITNEMDSTGNWANISAFYDYYDDFSLTKINYTNWLAEEITEAGPDW